MSYPSEKEQAAMLEAIHGDTLPNGATVLLAGRPDFPGRGLCQYQAVLCVWIASGAYVTWLWNCHTRNTSGGNYFPGLNSSAALSRALVDFNERANI